ncbi:MAG: hypothetical protein ACREKL_16835 [Chthoniobacterales bacterium]
MKIASLIVLAAMMAGCATHPVSQRKQDQVDLVNQTGIYSYQRAMGPPGAR